MLDLKINNWNIYYEVMGEGNPVVLVHGWLANIETMRPLANNLSKNFKVYMLDVVGFGKSDLPDHPLNSDQFGEFLRDFVNELHIENPILIGHSNGGRMIINAVGRGLINPRKVVLIDSAGLIPKRPLSYKIKVAIAKIGKAVLSILPNSEKLKEKLYAKVGSEDYRNSAEVLRESMKIILNEDLSELLPNIKVPTLLFWGTLDTATPIADGRKMAKLIPDAGIVEYPGATHFSYLENINNVNVVLNEFLKNDK